VNSRNDINKLVKAYVSGDGATGITANAITANANDLVHHFCGYCRRFLRWNRRGHRWGMPFPSALPWRKMISRTWLKPRLAMPTTASSLARAISSSMPDETATIDAFSLAASLAAGFSGTVSVALSGAGANALNSINNTVQSFVSGSTLTTQGSTGSVVVDADSEASISSLVGGLSAAIGVGGTVGVAGSIGIAIARNMIGVYDIDDDLATEHNQVLAYIDGSSTVTSAKHVQVTATANDTISTVSFAGSAAISGGILAVSAAGSGAEATSILNTRVAAYIANSDVAASGDIKVNADSTSEVSKALAIGASLSVAIGIGGAVSVAASVAKNVISDEVQASLSGNTGNMITASGQIDVTANATAGIGQDNGDDNVEISAVTASLAAGAFSASGGGLEIINTIDNDVDAYINGALTVGAAGDVNVRANETAYLEADASNVAVAIGVGAAAALGLATVENHMLSNIEAWVNQATVTSANTTVWAVADTNVAKTFSVGVSAAIALYSLAVADNTANVEIATLTKAYATNATLVSTGDIFINASSDNYARTDASGGALGAVAIGAMIADIALGKGHGIDEVVAEIGDNTSVTANALTISASSIDDLLSDSIAAGGGAIAASGAVANTSSDQATLARIGTNANLNITTSLTIGSTHVQDVDASADSYSIALASGSGAGVSNQINSKANIEIAANATVVANNIDIEAKNEAHKDEYLTDSNLRSGSASLGNITVLKSETQFGDGANPFEAVIDIQSGANLKAMGTNQNPSVFRVNASTNIDASDTVTIESVSGFGVSTGISRIKSRADAIINVDRAVLENTAGDLFLTTKADSNLSTDSSLVVATALTGGAGAEATTEATVNNTINVTNSTLKGDNVNLYAGRDNTGVPNVLLAFANAQITAASLLPSINVPVPNATINESNIINLGDASGTSAPSNLKAREDINLLAVEGLGGDNRASENGDVLSLSLIPYGVDVPDTSTVNSTNQVNVLDGSTLEAGLNSSSVMILRPVVDEGAGGLGTFDTNKYGQELTVTEKAALETQFNGSFELPDDVAYVYAEPDLDTFTYTVFQGTIVQVVAGANGGGEIDEFYQFKGDTESVLLENENYANTNRWEKITDTARAEDEANNIPARPAKSELTSDDYVASNIATDLAATLANQLYVIKPKDLDSPTLSIQDIGALLLQQRETIIRWMTNHSTNAEAVARYQVQLDELDETLQELGLLEEITINGVSTNIPKSLDAIFVDLPSIYAAPGSIFIEADESTTTRESLLELRSDGDLSVSDQAEIEVINQMPFTLTLGDAIIRDNKKVINDDGVLRTLQPGNIYFNNSSVGTENTSTASGPDITITQTPLSPLSRYAIDVPDVPRDIFVVGDIINENGGVTITNNEGSVNVEGEIRGQTVNILATGDFTLNTDDWLHTNKDPRQYINLDSLRTAARPATPVIGVPGTAITKTDASTVSDGTTTLAASIAEDDSKIMAQGEIVVTARYLNINGLIQSGVQDISLTIDSTFTPASTGATAFLDDNGDARTGITFGEGVPVEGYFDAEKQAIVVDEIVSQGGEITLAGQILSTGNGRLKVAHGFASVDIDNNTNYKLILNRIDTTEDRQGQITIIDTDSLRKTEYDVTDSGITETNYTGTLQTGSSSVSGSGTTVSSILYTLDGSPQSYTAASLATNPNLVQWQPQADLQYIWTEGQEATQTTITVYEDKSFNLFGGDTGFEDWLESDKQWKSRDTFFTDDSPLLESEVRAAIGEVDDAGQLLVPDYVNSAVDVNSAVAYSIQFVQKNDEAVEVLPNSTVVKYVGDGTKGTVGHRYQYNVGSKEVDIRLPDVNFNSSDWTDVTASTTEGEVDYESSFLNKTVTGKVEEEGGGWLQEKTVRTTIIEVIGIKDYYTHTLRADEPITILYDQAQTPSIAIDSQGSIEMLGNIDSDGSGRITITSRAGSVVTDASVAIFGASPTVSAGTSTTLNVEGVGTTSPKGAINVTAGGNIEVNAVASDNEPGRLLVDSIQSTSGNVVLNGPEGIAGLDGGSLISGNRIELSAVSGAMGNQATTALSINSNTQGTGGFAARALNDIAILETVGDLNLIEPEAWESPEASVLSTNGNVILSTQAGSIIDAFYETYVAPSAEEIAERDAQLQLTGDAAREAALTSIRTEEIIQTQLYHSYFLNFRNATINGTPTSALAINTINEDGDILSFASAHGLETGDQVFVDINGTSATAINLVEDTAYYVVKRSDTTIQLVKTRADLFETTIPTVNLQVSDQTGTAIPATGLTLQRFDYSSSDYAAPSDEDKAARYVAARYTEIDEQYGSSEYDPDFLYTISEEEKASRIAARQFSAAALNSPISRALFEALYPFQETDVQAGFKASPQSNESLNIIGSTVTLTAGGTTSTVGRLDAPVTLDLSQGFAGLTDPDQQQVLSEATVDDIMGRFYTTYRWNGSTSTTVNLDAAIDFSDSNWEAITPSYQTSVDAVVNIAHGDIVLVQLNADVYGLYQYNDVSLGAGTRQIDLTDINQNYGNSQRWISLSKVSGFRQCGCRKRPIGARFDSTAKRHH
jgi:hypothetical protein